MIFRAPPRRSAPVCRLLATTSGGEHPAGLTVQIRLDRARDTELLQAMRQAGISKVCIGFESPIAEELEAMNKRVKAEDMLAMTRSTPGRIRVHACSSSAIRCLRAELPDVRSRGAALPQVHQEGATGYPSGLLPVPFPVPRWPNAWPRSSGLLREIVGWEYYDGNFPLFKRTIR